MSQLAGMFTSNDFYDANGTKRSTLPYTKYEAQLYAEYGLSDDWTLGMQVSYAIVQRQFTTGALVTPPGFFVPTNVTVVNGEANYGWIDPEIFVRRRLYQDTEKVFSLELLHKMPSQLERNNASIAGTDERDNELALLAGYSFAWLGQHHFIDTRAAYRVRGGELKNQASFDAKLGVRFWDDFLFIPAIYYTWSDEVPSVASFLRDGREDYDLTKLEATLQYAITPWMSYQLSGFAHVDGENIGDGEAVMTGFVFRY